MNDKYKGKSIFVYVNFTPSDDSIGITKKIKAQINAFRSLGFSVTYTAYLNDGIGIYKDEKLVYFNKYLIKNEKYKRLRRRFLLIKSTIKYIKKFGSGYGYAYLRWHAFDRVYLKMLKTMKQRNMEIIIEAHAYTPNMKAPDFIGKYTVFMDKIYSRYTQKYASLVAGMSEYDNIWGVATVKIDNAVNLDEIKERVWEEKEGTIRILSVSNEYSYHGYDRLIKGIYNYYSNGGQRNLQINFVGVYLNSTKELVEKLALSERVNFLGKKYGDELDQIYNESDLGIGALAHHRIGMYAGSSLKTKEYFAKGLPFIYGWREPAFDDDYPYAKRFELNEEPIDINDLIKFYDTVKADPNMLINMRQFALKNYSWINELDRVFSALIN